MIQRIATAVVLIPLVLLLVLKAPAYLLIIVSGAVALLAIAEFLKLVTHYGIQPLSQLTYAFTVLFFISVIFASANLTPLMEATSTLYWMIVAAAIAPFVFLTAAMRRAELSSSYSAAAASTFAFAYIALPMALLVEIRRQPAGAIWVIYTLLAVWSGDIFAYFVGKSLGRHRMSPRISPKKTWEGAIASILASVVIGTVWFQHAPQVSSALLRISLIDRRSGMFGLEQPHLWPIILLSAVVNLAAQLGDLVESLIKRGAGVKDSGSILPGHGGMLDRIDAMLFAVPVVWAYTAWRMMQ
ncbi:MAG: phosphatidate cytidylyltransferase [Terriglobales bacterium]|jgi:phosphatidate cytidylyltransferase